MSIVVCNNKRRGRGAKHAKTCLNRRKEKNDAAPLIRLVKNKPLGSEFKKKNFFFNFPK